MHWYTLNFVSPTNICHFSPNSEANPPRPARMTTRHTHPAHLTSTKLNCSLPAASIAHGYDNGWWSSVSCQTVEYQAGRAQACHVFYVPSSRTPPCHRNKAEVLLSRTIRTAWSRASPYLVGEDTPGLRVQILLLEEEKVGRERSRSRERRDASGLTGHHPGLRHRWETCRQGCKLRIRGRGYCVRLTRRGHGLVPSQMQ